MTGEITGSSFDGYERKFVALTEAEMNERFPEAEGNISLILAQNPDITLALTPEQAKRVKELDESFDPSSRPLTHHPDTGWPIPRPEGRFLGHNEDW